jgi:chromosome segregation ATPase
MSEQQGLFTLADASRLSGLSTEALQLRIKRGKLAAEKGNDGQPRVRLTAADLEEFRRQAGQQKSTLTRQDGDRANALRVLDAAVDELREQAERERAALEGEATALRDALGRERERADRAEAEREAARAETVAERARATKAEAEREEARVRAASAEGEAKGLRLALDEAKRPSWRKLLGR